MRAEVERPKETDTEQVTAPPKPDVWVEAAPDAETQLDPPYNVIIHNKDATNSL